MLVPNKQLKCILLDFIPFLVVKFVVILLEFKPRLLLFDEKLSSVFIERITRDESLMIFDPRRLELFVELSLDPKKRLKLFDNKNEQLLSLNEPTLSKLNMLKGFPPVPVPYSMFFYRQLLFSWNLSSSRFSSFQNDPIL